MDGQLDPTAYSLEEHRRLGVELDSVDSGDPEVKHEEGGTARRPRY
jgi:hypothetical protein